MQSLRLAALRSPLSTKNFLIRSQQALRVSIGVVFPRNQAYNRLGDRHVNKIYRKISGSKGLLSEDRGHRPSFGSPAGLKPRRQLCGHHHGEPCRRRRRGSSSHPVGQPLEHGGLRHQLGHQHLLSPVLWRLGLEKPEKMFWLPAFNEFSQFFDLLLCITVLWQEHPAFLQQR